MSWFRLDRTLSGVIPIVLNVERKFHRVEKRSNFMKKLEAPFK